MKAAIVIVTYNRLTLLKECIGCIDNQTLKFNDIIIVDNHSSDGTEEFLKSIEAKTGYHIITEAENGGGAKGFKDGIEYAVLHTDSDWILVIDDDAMLLPNYLQTMSDATKRFEGVCAFSGSVMTNGVIDITHRKNLRNGFTFNIVPVPLNKYNEYSFEYDLSSFCGLFFKKSLINAIGYPKEEYFIWYDDSEYSLRIRNESKIININETYINHKTKTPSNTQLINWKGYYGIRNTGDVIKSHGNRFQFIFFKLRTRIAQYKNYGYYLISRNEYYKYCAKLYRDALSDLKNKNFGFNPQYHP